MLVYLSNDRKYCSLSAIVPVLAQRGLNLPSIYPGYAPNQHAAQAIVTTLPALAFAAAFRRLAAGMSVKNKCTHNRRTSTHFFEIICHDEAYRRNFLGLTHAMHTSESLLFDCGVPCGSRMYARDAAVMSSLETI
jgi:hypothetical protein